MAEEGGGGSGRSGVTWLVDPLDGTINYLWGVPQWSVSIAAEDAEGGLVGVVLDPCRDETFTAVRGSGARLGATTLRVREGAPLAEALIGTGFSYRAEERARQAARLTRVLPAVRDVRRFGSAALDLAWVAGGPHRRLLRDRPQPLGSRGRRAAGARGRRRDPGAPRVGAGGRRARA